METARKLVPELKKKEYTSKEQELIYDLARKYGGENKQEFVKEIKSLMLYDRMIYKQRILAALKGVI